MTIEERRAISWSEVQEILWEQSFDARADKWRAYTAFRGLPEDYPDLSTKVQRMREDPGAVPSKPGSLEWKERRVLDNFRMYERLSLRTGNSDWDIMLLGQHHGLPTRLLDWTSSPLAALFFACENYDDHLKDGVVWCVRRLETNAFLDPSIKQTLEQIGTSLFSLEALSLAYPTLAEFDQLPADSLIFFEPPFVSPRIAAQYAFFSVMPGVRTRLRSWLETHEDLCWKLIIPAGLKKELRERLMVMNISERTIYPDLEGTCRWIAAWYQ
jgi:hypothetical protein